MDKYLPHTDLAQATEADIQRVREAALERAAYLRWLADKITVSSDPILRGSIAAVLRQLAS